MASLDMTHLPSGLASISARLDDSPQVRGAVAFGRMVREREDDAATERAMSDLFAYVVAYQSAEKRCGKFPYRSEPNTIGSAIDRHAALAVSAGYRSADRR